MGKSYLITVLFSIFSELVATVSKLLLLIKATPTNIITFSING
jgi:hypothetical protein